MLSYGNISQAELTSLIKKTDKSKFIKYLHKKYNYKFGDPSVILYVEPPLWQYEENFSNAAFLFIIYQKFFMNGHNIINNDNGPNMISFVDGSERIFIIDKIESRQDFVIDWDQYPIIRLYPRAPNKYNIVQSRHKVMNQYSSEKIIHLMRELIEFNMLNQRPILKALKKPPLVDVENLENIL